MNKLAARHERVPVNAGPSGHRPLCAGCRVRPGTSFSAAAGSPFESGRFTCCACAAPNQTPILTVEQLEGLRTRLAAAGIMLVADGPANVPSVSASSGGSGGLPDIPENEAATFPKAPVRAQPAMWPGAKPGTSTKSGVTSAGAGGRGAGAEMGSAPGTHTDGSISLCGHAGDTKSGVANARSRPVAGVTGMQVDDKTSVIARAGDGGNSSGGASSKAGPVAARSSAGGSGESGGAKRESGMPYVPGHLAHLFITHSQSPTAAANRKARLARYRAKRLARQQAAISGHKKIRYACRKTLADSRPRIKGRFAKVNSPESAAAAAEAAKAKAKAREKDAKGGTKGKTKIAADAKPPNGKRWGAKTAGARWSGSKSGTRPRKGALPLVWLDVAVSAAAAAASAGRLPGQHSSMPRNNSYDWGHSQASASIVEGMQQQQQQQQGGFEGLLDHLDQAELECSTWLYDDNELMSSLDFQAPSPSGAQFLGHGAALGLSGGGMRRIVSEPALSTLDPAALGDW